MNTKQERLNLRLYNQRKKKKKQNKTEVEVKVGNEGKRIKKGLDIQKNYFWGLII